MGKRLVDQDCPLYVQQAGRVLVIGSRGLPPLEGLDGATVVLIGEGTREALSEWLGRVEVAEAARILGVGTGKVQRLRQALGLTELYKGTSRTTQWRRKKAVDSE